MASIGAAIRRGVPLRTAPVPGTFALKNALRSFFATQRRSLIAAAHHPGRPRLDSVANYSALASMSGMTQNSRAFSAEN